MSEQDKSAPDVVVDKKSGNKKPAGAKSAARGKLSREVKIGLTVIAALAVTFGGVLAYKVRSGIQEADEIADAKKKATEGQQDGKLPDVTPSSKLLDQMNASTGSPKSEPFDSTASRGAAAADMPPTSPYGASASDSTNDAWPPADGGAGAADTAPDEVADTAPPEDPFRSAPGFMPPGDGRPVELAPGEPAHLYQGSGAVAAADDGQWPETDPAYAAETAAATPERESFSSAITPAAAKDTATTPPADGYQYYGDEAAAPPASNATARSAPRGASSEPRQRFDISTPAQSTQPSNNVAAQPPAWGQQPAGRIPANTASTGNDYNQGFEDRMPTADVAMGRGGESSYTVAPNDSYWSISESHYRTGAYFKALQRYNRSETSRREGLNVGDTVAIPSIDVLEQKYPELCPKRSRAMAAGGNVSTVGARGGAGTRVYVVQEGDTVFGIARYELGNARYAKQIVDLNRDALREDIHFLPRGMELLLPDVDYNDNESPVTRRPEDRFPR